MSDLDADYRLILNDELRARKSKNSRYSIRAFAKFLGVDNGFLSKLLSGKILLSLDLADNFSKKLKLSPEQRKTFLLSAVEEQKCHTLYLLDPSLTDCSEDLPLINPLPVKKR